ncbi:MAG TPA: cobalt-zinc-cadmium resistance protein [Telluria sp.]|nr:cobalt-zinc-cadmium resistance protein [Telluria sp.]
MKRLILIILLALVPLQFAWAAAGAYCLHEEGTSSLHFGHHAHTHQAKSDSSDSKTKVNKAHLDCSSCHAPANVIWNAAPSLKVLSSQGERYAPVSLLYSSFIPDGPRRPDRLPGA